MSTREAFGRLFPPSLFLFLGALFCRAWYFDPLLIGIALCVAGAALSWLILAVVQVAKGLPGAPAKTRAPADEPASADAG